MTIQCITCKKDYAAEGDCNECKEAKIMGELSDHYVNELLERMIRRTFYNELGEFVSDKIKSIIFGTNEITVTYVNGQCIEFTAELYKED
ncbi:hypothetical protein LCGC14_1191000 [marine sediment metagenome]|uniref:Uncharacterized protein n=1 Tax=marine sediment metagenome TaxID=412755 RepID=A0A0F9LJD2_9ZZZZ